MGCLVDVVVTLGLEEEMAGLARGHRDQPADQRGDQRIEEHHQIADHEADRADEVQALIDPAVVIVAVVVPALDAKLLKEAFDHFSPPKIGWGCDTSIRCMSYDIIKMSYDIILQSREISQPRAKPQAAAAIPSLRKRTSEKWP